MLPAVVLGEVNLVLNLQTELREGKEGEEGGYDHSHIEMWVVAAVEGGEVEGEQTFDEHPRQVDAFDAEEASGQHDDEEGEEYAGDFA